MQDHTIFIRNQTQNRGASVRFEWEIKWFQGPFWPVFGIQSVWDQWPLPKWPRHFGDKTKGEIDYNNQGPCFWKF